VLVRESVLCSGVLGTRSFAVWFCYFARAEISVVLDYGV